MILNDGTIKGMLPTLFPEHSDLAELEKQVQPASIDLRLGPDIYKWKSRSLNIRGYHTIDPEKDDAANYMEKVECSSGYLLRPGTFILTSTVEYVHVPRHLVARVEGRSSLGRLGMRIHSTAGFIDPGFCGNITLELDVTGIAAVWLRPGMRICQLSYQYLNSEAEIPYGNPLLKSKYQHQAGVAPSRIHEDQ